jgi:hypothetical protein
MRSGLGSDQFLAAARDLTALFLRSNGSLPEKKEAHCSDKTDNTVVPSSAYGRIESAVSAFRIKINTYARQTQTCSQSIKPSN